MTTADPKRVQELLDRIERERGLKRVWPRLLAERDPDMLERIHDCADHVLNRRNAMPRQYKEILMICLNAYQFREHGFRNHTRAALKHGATEDEILEGLEVVSLISLHGMTSMLPALIEEFEAFKAASASGAAKQA